jgi:hypothetical protein
MTTPNSRERQIMQRLRGRSWVRALELPESPQTMDRLLEKRWIESMDEGRKLSFRLTEEGLAAKKAPVPVPRR